MVDTQFALKSPIKVMRMDLLEKEQGVSELYRTTYVKAIMRGDGSFLVVWAGEVWQYTRKHGGTTVLWCNVCPLLYINSELVGKITVCNVYVILC